MRPQVVTRALKRTSDQVKDPPSAQGTMRSDKTAGRRGSSKEGAKSAAAKEARSQRPKSPPTKSPKTKGAEANLDQKATKAPAGNHTKVSKKVNEVLKTFFGLETFRPGQEEVVRSFIEGKDCAVFRATAFGKSLCFQLPALVTGKIYIVVTPTIALMIDQTETFNQLAVKSGDKCRAVYLGSAQEDPSTWARVLEGQYGLVYVTPETLVGNAENFEQLKARLLGEGKLGGFVIDEADLTFQWGYSFRPDFLQLAKLKEEVPDLPLMVLTGSAPPWLKDRLLDMLHIKQALLSEDMAFRENLELKTTLKFASMEENLDYMAEKIRRGDRGATIVYVPFVLLAKSVAKQLQERLWGDFAIRVEPFFGKMEPKLARRLCSEFASGHIDVIVSTLAFGRGIDRADVRRIFHWGLPKNVEEYVQQIGRAGRDGEPALCELLWNPMQPNPYTIPPFFESLQEFAPKDQQMVLESYEVLRMMAAGRLCRWHRLRTYFGHELDSSWRCGNCDHCRQREREESPSQDNQYQLCEDAERPLAVAVLEALASAESKGMLMQGVCDLWQASPPQTGVEQDASECHMEQRFSEQAPSKSTVKLMVKKLYSNGYLTGAHAVKSGRVETRYMLSEAGREALNGAQLKWSVAGRSQNSESSSLKDLLTGLKEDVEDFVTRPGNLDPADKETVLQEVSERLAGFKKRAQKYQKHLRACQEEDQRPRPQEMTEAEGPSETDAGGDGSSTRK